MADYCYHCYPDMFPYPAEENDLRDDNCPEDAHFFAICEGCGPGWFDREGKRTRYAIRGKEFWFAVEVPPSEVVFAAMLTRDWKPDPGWIPTDCPSCGKETWHRPEFDAELYATYPKERVVRVCTECMVRLGARK